MMRPNAVPALPPSGDIVEDGLPTPAADESVPPAPDVEELPTPFHGRTEEMLPPSPPAPGLPALGDTGDHRAQLAATTVTGLRKRLGPSMRRLIAALC